MVHVWLLTFSTALLFWHTISQVRLYLRCKKLHFSIYLPVYLPRDSLHSEAPAKTRLSYLPLGIYSQSQRLQCQNPEYPFLQQIIRGFSFVVLERNFFEKVNFDKSMQTTKNTKIPSMQMTVLKACLVHEEFQILRVPNKPLARSGRNPGPKVTFRQGSGLYVRK